MVRLASLVELIPRPGGIQARSWDPGYSTGNSSEKDLFADANRLKAFVDMLLKELHEHYKSTYWNYAERLATLMIVVGEFHVSMRRVSERITHSPANFSKSCAKRNSGGRR